METNTKIAFAICLLAVAMVATSFLVTVGDADARQKNKNRQNNDQGCFLAQCGQINQQNNNGPNNGGGISFNN